MSLTSCYSTYATSGNKLAVALLIAILAPLLLPINIATEILIFGMFAMAANLLIGTAGLYSFGQAAFFGVGGYAAGYCFAHTAMPLWGGLALATAAAAGVAAVIGAISIRRIGIYFMMVTFAFNQMIYYIAYSWSSVTGGEDGLGGIRRPLLGLPFGDGISLNDTTNFYLLTAVLFLGVFVVLLQLTSSPLGLVLDASKQNARRTASLGYSVYRAQLTAFIVAGALSGLAGALYALLYRIMPLDAISWASSGTVVFMVVIGGMSTLIGPVFGAAIFIWLQGFFSLIWARWPLLFGVFIIVVVLFLRGGVMELFARIKALANKRNGGEKS
ncbi:branched-chain amino acid ABC transporter permease [Herbaspirillum autotrophicum]|uniref:branched-chain amino acid ABC transporter permease n=1 Tax=Herbaspirillum autotrophicum TaxID=180195 RepID=UPI00067B6ACE|nr:branched-chain amino acid ABC transporter permease [Herbaspirillum autotrophicum]